MEELYVQNLLACGRHEEILGYLKGRVGPGEALGKLRGRHLCFLIKYYF